MQHYSSNFPPYFENCEKLTNKPTAHVSRILYIPIKKPVICSCICSMNEPLGTYVTFLGTDLYVAMSIGTRCRVLVDCYCAIF